MAKHGKKYRDSVAQVDRLQSYAPREAFDLVKQLSYAKFDETVEAHIRLNIDSRQAEQQVRGVVSLPAGTGKSVRILVFAEGEAARQAEEAGADYVGVDEYVERISAGWVEFDVAVAIPQVMGRIGRLGRVLGPRGLMPSPRAGTMIQPNDVAETIRALRQGRVEFRADRNGNLHIPLGKVSFSADALTENWSAVLDAVLRARPTTVKGRYILRITFTSTMGPGVHIDPVLAQDTIGR
ncbi:MAG: 50S ribosomal protein L1 [Chloroflexi bacterium RBG_13_56_8]|nr:MAG: 50S ribosomal protein L1 [Chloroflexi bacterium RBG_13_56_8]